MPFRPRIFISHAAGGDEQVRSFLTALKDGLEAAGFDVLLDFHTIETGERWRAVIDSWIWHCDAAIGVISSRSVTDESKWMPFELAHLLQRRRFNADTFTLRTLRFENVTTADVDAAFPALELNEFQAAIIQNRAELSADRRDPNAVTLVDAVSRVLDDLRPVLDRREPRNEVESHLLDFLSDSNNLSMEGLTNLAGELGLDNVPGSARRDVAIRVARTLFEFESDELDVNFQRLEQFVRRLLAAHPNPAIAQRVIKMVSPLCWVDPQACVAFEQRVLGRDGCAVAFGREWQLTEWMVLQRAFCLLDGNLLLGPEESFGSIDDYLEDLRQKLASFLLGNADRTIDRIQRALARRRRRGGRRLFVLLPFAVLDDQLAATLRDRWPEIVFLIYAPDLSTDDLHQLGWPSLAILDPPVDPDHESDAEQEFRRLMRLAGIDNATFGNLTAEMTVIGS